MVIIIEGKTVNKMVKIVDENKNEIKLDNKICHRFQTVVVPYQVQGVTGVETRVDMRQINCYREKCELWFIEEGMCAEKYNYIKNREGEVM